LLSSALLLSCVLLAGWAQAAIEVTDDTGQKVRLEKPATRIISFAPHVTETLFAVGAGHRIVGVVKHSDFPEDAKKIPEIGVNRAADLERIVSFRPDLIIAWLHAGSMKQLDRLRSTGIPVYYSNPETLAAIAREGERFAQMTGTVEQAQPWLRQYRSRLQGLVSTYSQRPRIPVFYQMWPRPIYTLNNHHFVGDLLAACGASNVFGSLPVVAPVVNVEAVLNANPQAIIGASPISVLQEQWGPWKDMDAVKFGNVFSVNADLTHRAGPRALDAAEILCQKIDEARRRVGAVPAKPQEPR
jgi:iron complex transport system substrate-binding protein